MSKDQIIAFFALLLLGALLAVAAIVVNKFGWVITLTGIFLSGLLVTLAWLIRKKLRFSSLLNKYQDEDIANKIIKRTLWQGQTAEQVKDALGSPKDIDQKILKTKTKETWKYFPSGRRRYGLRITLDNGIVVGWDKKI